MATEPDPHRTLGLAPTASLAEVKAAYRRLAKANHPDTAGEAALPRFLAIQAAYDRLVGPTPGRAKATGSAATAPRKPWEADPDRRDATYRAYGGRARRPAGESASRAGRAQAKAGGSATTGGSAKTETAGGAGRAGSGSTGTSGSTGPSETAGGAKAGKPPKRATLGSTSYDGVDREAFEPDWAGANWYGTTSGTYWTINPKEYADPRKHGPEYQARARRAAKRPAGLGPEEDPIEATGPAPEAPGTAEPTRPTSDTEPPRHTTASWWDSTSGAAATDRDAAQAPPPRPTPSAPPRPAPAAPATPAASPSASSDPAEPSPSPSLSDVWHALTLGGAPSIGWRIARAVIAWIPVALAIGWAAGELTGCGRFSATCDPGTAPVAWGAQALALGLLLAAPSVAGWGVVAAVVCLVVAVPATLFITASAGAQASQRGAAFLGVVLVIAWIAGAVGAAVLGRRSSRGPTSGPTSGPTGPVS